MTKVNITGSEPNKAPSQPADGQQPGEQNANQQQNDQANKDKPAQQK